MLSRTNPGSGSSDSISSIQSTSSTPRKNKSSQDPNQDPSTSPSSFKASVLSRVNPAFLSQSDSNQQSTTSPQSRYAPLNTTDRAPGAFNSPSLRGNTPLPIPSRSSSVVSPSPTGSSFPKRTSSIMNPDQSTEILANSIADLTLDDNSNNDSFSSSNGNGVDDSLDNSMSFENQNQELDSEDLSHLLDGIVNHCHDLESEIFQIQEKRHMNSQNPSSKDVEMDADSSMVKNEQDLAYMKVTQKIEQCSKQMNTLEVGLKKLEEEEGKEEDESFSERNPTINRNRRNSLTSLNSLSSFDEEFQPGSLDSKDTKSIRKRFEETSVKWLEIQQQSSTLEQELIDDKKENSFNSQCSQIENMLNSLDKGLLAGNDFVKILNNYVGASQEDEEFKSKMEEFEKLKKSIGAKKLYYEPAIEQMFGILERNLKGRITSNGIMLKKHSDLKSRWKVLRESTRRVIKDMTSIERKLNGEADVERIINQDSNLSPMRNNNSSTPSRPALRPKHSGRNLGSNSSAPVSPASTSSNLNSPPPKPPKSLRRTSMIVNESSNPSANSHSSPSASKTLRSKISNSNFNPGSSLPSSNAGGPFARHGRSASTSAYQQQLSPENQRGLRGSNPPISMRPAWNNSIKVERDKNGLIDRDSRNHYNPDNSLESIGSNSSSNSESVSNRRPSFNESMMGTNSGRSTPSNNFGPSSYRNPSMLGAEKPGITMNNGSRVSSRSKTPQPQPTWTSSRAGSEPPIPAQNPARDRNGSARPPSRTENRTTYSRPASSTGHYPSSISRPVSSVGNYYHPPQSTHEVETGKSPRKRDSMIPRLAFPSSTNSGSDHHHPSRPGSSMSQRSDATAYNTQSGPPISSSRYNGASRLSMQTPEPMIAARVNRMNMFTRPSGKASTSKPPVSQSSRLNNGSSITSPLNIRKLGTPGRTTPLSAAALEKIPHAGPSIISNSGSGGAGSGSGSSVANFRAQRGTATTTNSSGSHHQHGGREGAITPGYSEGGNSSVGGFSNSTFNHLRGHHSGPGSSYGNGFDFYKPNPNDSLDLAVAKIVNELGARCERIDLPLPRGQKLELGPGKSAQARYEIAGKKVACRMLELHRPAGSAGSQAGVNTRKISVRVGGGYQDLKLWLYDRMSLE